MSSSQEALRDSDTRPDRPSRRGFLAIGAWLAATLWGGIAARRAKARVPAVVRPPGALPEADFLAACLRCGQCVEACPTQILHLTGAASGVGVHTPYLIPRDRPCDLCMGRPRLECVAVCPSGALAPVGRRDEVRMGVAVIDRDTCLPWHGVACRACWHACPFPNDAIRLDARGRAAVVSEACVGCGLCEHACLTDPPAIRVVPAGRRSGEETSEQSRAARPVAAPAPR